MELLTEDTHASFLMQEIIIKAVATCIQGKTE